MVTGQGSKPLAGESHGSNEGLVSPTINTLGRFWGTRCAWHEGGRARHHGLNPPKLRQDMVPYAGPIAIPACNASPLPVFKKTSLAYRLDDLDHLLEKFDGILSVHGMVSPIANAENLGKVGLLQLGLPTPFSSHSSKKTSSSSLFSVMVLMSYLLEILGHFGRFAA